MRILFSFLGLSEYVPVRYRLGEVENTQDEKFIQSALIELLWQSNHLKIDKLVVGVTNDVRKGNNYRELIERINNIPEERRPEIQDFSLLDGKTDNELWKNFENILSQLDNQTEVYFDVTHGFRSLPIVALMAFEFSRQLSTLQFHGPFYGAFEVLGSAKDVKEKKKADPTAVFVAPVFQLDSMLKLLDWAQAASEWKRTGRLSKLVDLAKNHIVAREDRELAQLMESLTLLNEALAFTKESEIPKLANRVQTNIFNASKQFACKPELAPLERALRTVEKAIEPLDSTPGEWSKCDDDYLKRQPSLAQWYAERNYYGQAFAIIRECLTSCCERMLTESQISVPGRDKPFATPASPTYRKFADEFIFLDIDKVHPNHKEQFKNFRSTHDEFIKLAQSLESTCRQYRNRIQHCWTSSEHAEIKFNKNEVEKMKAALAKSIDESRQLVSLVTTKRTVSNNSRTGLANVTSLNVLMWSSEQRLAAQALGHGEVKDFALPDIAPNASANVVEALAQELANSIMMEKLAGAVISSDLTFSYKLVSRLKSSGIRCYAPIFQQIDRLNLGNEQPTDNAIAFEQFVCFREFL